MRLRPPDRGENGEHGAIAVMTAFLMVAFLVVAALGVDITTQVNQRQKLYDTIDAAAQAGAYRLPSVGTNVARDDALAFAHQNDPDVTPDVDFFCVVASRWSGSAWVVDATQIPSTCNPASFGTTYTPVVPCTATSVCSNSRISSIPCKPELGDTCNTARVRGNKPVPFSFAPVIGINQGSTGSVSSAACKGSCGTVPLNPMDVAVVADRTGSMSSTDITAMITGIKSMFQVMTPSQQYVSLGTIGRSLQGATETRCNAATSHPTVPAKKALSEPSGSATSGPWVPVPFSNDYLTTGTTNINASSTLVNAVECLKNSSGTGTHLASPMKAAARYLLGIDPNNLGSLPARTGTIRKAIIFETDGAPNESNFAGTTALNDPVDIGSTNGATACTNLTTVANKAKDIANNILVVTVAYNVSTSTLCGGSGTARLDQTLAAAASNAPSGVASAANFNCATTDGRASENTDGDYFFCAGTGTDMASIYKTAFTQIANGIRLIRLP